MGRIRWLMASLGLLALVGSWADAGPPASLRLFPFTERRTAPSAADIPWSELPAGKRDRVRQVVEQPSLYARGPSEEFTGDPALYRWLLAHPAHTAAAWRRLGVECVCIEEVSPGVFRCSDGAGFEVRWETVYSGKNLHIWYAEGNGRPCPWLPTVPVRGVAVLRHGGRIDPLGRPNLSHQVDLFLQTDSQMAALIARLLGPSLPRLAEQGLEQM
ncbi:MAG: hypothetical protein NZ700_08695, partial [Gemmataceae bacterium]|nr:hypothetical protein [Gemmataceae bacterium]